MTLSRCGWVRVHMRVNVRPAMTLAMFMGVPVSGCGYRGQVPVPRGTVMRMGVPPQHHLLDDEEDPETRHERDTNSVRARRPNTLHGLGQQRQQGRTQQGTGREADEMRQHAGGGPLREQQKHARERGTRDAAKCREQDDPSEERHERSASSGPIRSS